MIYATHFTPVSTLKNNGQRAEFDACLALCDYGKNPDNVKGTEKPDFILNGYGVQCKTARATICNGYDYFDYIFNKCACHQYCYVCYTNQTLYLFTKDSFYDFVSEFHYFDKDSKTSLPKIRLAKESKRMREWLERHTNCKPLPL